MVLKELGPAMSFPRVTAQRISGRVTLNAALPWPLIDLIRSPRRHAHRPMKPEKRHRRPIVLLHECRALLSTLKEVDQGTNSLEGNDDALREGAIESVKSRSVEVPEEEEESKADEPSGEEVEIDVINDKDWMEKVPNRVLKTMSVEELEKICSDLGYQARTRETMLKRIKFVRGKERKKIDYFERTLTEPQKKLYNLPVEKLKEMCRARCMIQCGNKAELTKRLIKARHRWTDEEELLLETFSVGQIRSLANIVGANPEGRKLTVIKRLTYVRDLILELDATLKDKPYVREPITDSKKWERELWKIYSLEELRKMNKEQGLGIGGSRKKLITKLYRKFVGDLPSREPPKKAESDDEEEEPGNFLEMKYDICSEPKEEEEHVDDNDKSEEESLSQANKRTSERAYKYRRSF